LNFLILFFLQKTSRLAYKNARIKNPSLVYPYLVLRSSFFFLNIGLINSRIISLIEGLQDWFVSYADLGFDSHIFPRIPLQMLTNFHKNFKIGKIKSSTEEKSFVDREKSLFYFAQVLFSLKIGSSLALFGSNSLMNERLCELKFIINKSIILKILRICNLCVILLV